MRIINLLLILLISCSLPLQVSASLLAPLTTACPAQAQTTPHCCKKAPEGYGQTLKHCKADQGCENHSPLPPENALAPFLDLVGHAAQQPNALAALPLTVYATWRPPSLTTLSLSHA
jgi:hypothetical protein